MELLRALPPNCNRSLKCQAIQKLYKYLCEKNIDHNKQECEELSFLWQCAQSEDDILSFLSFEAILNLMRHDKLSALHVMRKIIDSFKISRSKIECLHALKNIFSFVNVIKFKVTTTNLGLTHPFNALLSSDITSVLLFVPVLKDMFNNYDLQNASFSELMDPFFKYVFMQTRNSNAYAPIRQTIVNAFLQDKNNLNYLFNILKWMEIEDNRTEFLEYLDLLSTKANIAQEVLNLILCVYWSFTSSMQNTIMDFILKIVRMNTNLAENDLLLFCCLANLMNLTDLSRTYEILFLILKKNKFVRSKHYMSMFILPLLQLVINSDQKAAYLFTIINDHLLCSSINTHKKVQPVGISSLNTLMYLCENILQQPDKLKEWLKNACDKSSLSSPTYELMHLIGGIIHMSTSSDVLQISIDTLQKICINNPHLSIELFPLLMSKLKKHNESEQCLILLKSLPAISTNKVSTSMTLNFLLSSGGLSSTSTNLMLALWKNHDDCFSHLIGRLQDCKSSPNEMALIQAGCLRDICTLSASKHGKECVGMLFQLLERKDDRPVRILCMESIYHLCVDKVLSFQSFWLYFQNNLKQLLILKSVSPVEVRSILKVFHVLIGSSNTNLVTEVICYLWELLSLSNANKCVINEIFNALSQFPRNVFMLSQLPQDVTSNQMMKMEEKEVEDREVIYGDTFMALIGKYYSKEVHQGVSNLFAKLMDEELTTFPRGIFFKHKEMIKLSFTYQLKMDSDHVREVDLKISKLATTCLYLPANSLLKSCFEYIINFIKHGMPEDKIPVFKMILISLTKDSTKNVIPPFNWIFILRPILLHFTENIDEEAVELCYKLIFNQSVQYPVLGHLLIQLIESPEFGETEALGQKIILKNFSDLLTICTVKDINSKFKKLVFPFIDGRKNDDGLMQDLVLSLKNFVSSQVALKESKNSVWEIFSMLIDKMNIEQHKGIEAFIEKCPQVVIDRLLLITDDCKDVNKLMLIRSSIINQRTISFINHNIEAFVKINSNEVEKCFALVLKLIVFQNSHQHPTTTLKQWMTELIGFITFSTKQQSISDQAADWLVVIWFASIIKWSNCGLSELLYFPLDLNYDVIMKFAMDTNYNEFICNIINIFPRSICHLLSNAEWSIIAEKVLDLLYHLLSVNNIFFNSLISDAIKESLRLLKRVESCKNPLFWLKTAELLDFRKS